VSKKEGKLLKVVASDPVKPKKRKDDIEPAKCRRCERETGVGNIDYGLMYTGGFMKNGRLVGAKKALYCLHCYGRDGTVEIIAYM
jgi:hypothetical protein